MLYSVIKCSCRLKKRGCGIRMPLRPARVLSLALVHPFPLNSPYLVLIPINRAYLNELIRNVTLVGVFNGIYLFDAPCHVLLESRLSLTLNDFIRCTARGRASVYSVLGAYIRQKLSLLAN